MGYEPDIYKRRGVLFAQVEADESLSESERTASEGTLGDHYPSSPSDDGDFSTAPSCIECGEPYPCKSVEQIARRYGG